MRKKSPKRTTWNCSLRSEESKCVWGLDPLIFCGAANISSCFRCYYFNVYYFLIYFWNTFFYSHNTFFYKMFVKPHFLQNDEKMKVDSLLSVFKWKYKTCEIVLIFITYKLDEAKVKTSFRSQRLSNKFAYCGYLHARSWHQLCL